MAGRDFLLLPHLTGVNFLHPHDFSMSTIFMDMQQNPVAFLINHSATIFTIIQSFLDSVHTQHVFPRRKLKVSHRGGGRQLMQQEPRTKTRKELHQQASAVKKAPDVGTLMRTDPFLQRHPGEFACQEDWVVGIAVVRPAEPTAPKHDCRYSRETSHPAVEVLVVKRRFITYVSNFRKVLRKDIWPITGPSQPPTSSPSTLIPTPHCLASCGKTRAW
jgi:hypothetical protein